MAQPSKAAARSSAETKKPETPTDLTVAFNSRFFAHRLDSKRTPRLLIRVSKTNADAVSMKNAKETLDTLGEDQSNPGKEWSDAELDIKGYRKAEIALVVGVLLSEESVNIAKPTLPLTPLTFDATKHTMVSSDDNARILVTMLSADRGNLYILTNKNPDTGLCRALPMPTATNYLHRVFFFPEWMENTLITGGHVARFHAWKRNLANFIKKYVHDHAADFVNEPVRPSAAAAARKLPDNAALSPTHSRDGSIFENAMLFEATRLPTFLVAAGEGLKIALGELPEEEAMRQAAKTVENLIMGRDEVDEEEAADAAKACKKLWFNGKHDVIRLDCKPEHLLSLAKGIRKGALDTSLIEPRLFKGIIIAFCEAAEMRDQYNLTDKIRVKDMIQKAYRTAVLHHGSPQPTTSESTPLSAYPKQSAYRIAYLDGATTAVCALNARFKDIIQEADYAITQLRMRILGAVPGPRIRECDFRTLVLNTARTTDIEENLGLVEQIAFTILTWCEGLSTNAIVNVMRKLARENDKAAEEMRKEKEKLQLDMPGSFPTEGENDEGDESLEKGAKQPAGSA